MHPVAQFDLSALLWSCLRVTLQEVDEIATAYHWSEEDILTLSRKRRREYLDLIDRDNRLQR